MLQDILQKQVLPYFITTVDVCFVVQLLLSHLILQGRNKGEFCPATYLCWLISYQILLLDC